MMTIVAVALALVACDETSATPDAAAADQKIVAEASVDASALADAGATHEAGALDAKPTPDAGAGDQAALGDKAAPDAKLPDMAVADLPTGCNPAKVGFTQSNAKKYELYELCFKAGDAITEALVKALDSTLTCKHSAGGIAAKCPSGTWRCMAPLQLNYPAKDIKNAQWQAICAMSWLPAVSKIAGGYYI
jgi:hypothetical protein